MPIEVWWHQSSRKSDAIESDHVVLEGPGPFTIGRSSQNDIVLNHAQVSRTHAEISVDGPIVTVVDKGSQNGTLIGGQRLTARAPWTPEKELVVGPFALRFRWAVSASRAAETHDDATVVSPAPRARPGGGRAEEPGRAPFPGALFNQRIVPMKEIAASGKLAGEVDFLAIGGGLGSFSWVDHLRIYGVPATRIRVLGIAIDRRPYAKWWRLCHNSQIPDHERIRSNSISAADNIWGFPGYASREMVRDVLRGRLVGIKYILQVFGEPALTESYTPRLGDVCRSIDREAARIGWDSMWVSGRVLAIRKTDDERYVVAYRVPSDAMPDLPEDKRDRFIVGRNVQISTGYPASNFLPDLQDFRHAYPNSTAVVNSYEDHDFVYKTLEQKGGTLLMRGRGIVASRVIQRIHEARERNKEIRLLHLLRSSVSEGAQYDLARRPVGHGGVALQPFNWPKSAWGGTLKKLLEKSSPEDRARLMSAWGGTHTADRDDWNHIIEEGLRDGWYKIYYGKVASIGEKGGKVVTRLESTERQQENVDLTADFVVDCTGLIARVDETPLIADLIKTYDLQRNRASGEGPELRLTGLAVSNNFEVTGLQNGRGHVFAAGVVTFNGPYAGVDSILGLQYAALRSVDLLGAQRTPGVSRFGPVRSCSQWLKWCTGAQP